MARRYSYVGLGSSLSPVQDTYHCQEQASGYAIGRITARRRIPTPCSRSPKDDYHAFAGVVVLVLLAHY
eukprot:6180633-Pleurochrysis_carterae.AAC.4